ncbi:hypothetical protein P7K49_020333, partial [Saguinus oedipus]
IGQVVLRHVQGFALGRGRAASASKLLKCSLSAPQELPKCSLNCIDCEETDGG